VGAFKDKKFTSGPIDDEDEATVATYLSWDNDNKQVIYNPAP
jgi:hypothetical protein